MESSISLHCHCNLRRSIHHRNLVIQRPEVVQIADPEQARGAQVYDARDPLAHVEAVNAEQAEEGEQPQATV